MPSKTKVYKVGEACRRLDIQPYVLRYWETEFSFLKNDKSKSGKRGYSEEGLQTLARIKELLYDDGYTIAGAKKKIEAEFGGDNPAARESATTSKDIASASAAKVSKSAPAKKASAGAQVAGGQAADSESSASEEVLVRMSSLEKEVESLEQDLQVAQSKVAELQKRLEAREGRVETLETGVTVAIKGARTLLRDLDR